MSTRMAVIPSLRADVAVQATPAPPQSGPERSTDHDRGASFGHDFGAIAVVPDPQWRVTDRHEPAEREADRVANALTRPQALPPPAINASLSRHETANTLLPHAGARAPDRAPAGLSASLTSAARAGAALAPATRAEFEPRLNRPLADVRVHTDGSAASAAHSLNARAFTHGQDIFFGAGAYQPETPSGRWLLAHEIAHTQQAAPGVVARFVADAPIPAPPSDLVEPGEAESNPPAAVAEEIDRTLGTDPGDTSGQAAGRLARVPPAKRRPAVSKLRRRQGPMQEPEGPGVISRPAPEPRVAATTSSSPRSPAPRQERPPGSREEQTRQSAAAGAPASLPREPAGAARPPPPSATAAPRVPPSATRASPEPRLPDQLPATPPRQQPGKEKPDTGKAAGSADEASAPGAPADGEKGPAKGGGEDGPLSLTELFEPAENQPGPGGPAPAPMGTAVAPGAADSPSGFSDTFSSSRTGGEGAANAFGPTVRLAAPIVPVEDEAGEEPVEEAEARDPAVIAAELEGYAAQLETALATAREALQAKAGEVRAAVLRSAGSARAGIRASVDRTTAAIQAGGQSLLSELASSVSAAHGTLNGCLAARIAETTVKGTASQTAINGIFSGHRTTVDRTVNTAVEDAEKLRAGKVESAKKRNQADIKAAYAAGGAKLRSYPGTNRGSYIGCAAFDVAEGTANEMRSQEPDIVAAINEVTAPLPQHFRDQGTQALDGFDQNLPEIIASVTTGIGETHGVLGTRAAEAHQQLDQFAADTQREISGLMDDAMGQARDALPPAEQQLDRALGEILRSIAAAPNEVNTRVAPPIEEAIALFRAPEDADADSAPQLTEVLTGFLEESVTSTSATLDQAATAGKERFQAMSGGVRQAMRTLQSRSDGVWEASRSGIATTLARTLEGADAGLGGVVDTFGGALRETEQSIRDQLSPVVSDLKGSFATALRDAGVDIDSRIADGMAKNTEALGSLDEKMQEAADEAAWEWDHPVLSALEFIAGILVGIIKVLALVVLLIVVVIVLAKVLAVSALVAGIILLVGMVAFSIGYGFGARLAAGQGVGEAFGGAVMDFGRAAPGMLYDMTGIPKLKRAFSDERMSRYERGKLIGEGGTELVLAIFAVRGAAKGIATGFRKLPRIPWRRPVRVTAPTTAPTPATVPRAPVSGTPPTTPKAPAATTPPAGTGATGGGRVAPVEPVPSGQPGRLQGLPGGNQPSGTPRPPPELRAIQGGGGRPTVAPEPAPRVQNVKPEAVPQGQKPNLRAVEGGGQPAAQPGRPPELRVIKGGGGRGPKGPTEPTPPQAQPQRAAKAAGAEGHEPVIGEPLQPQRPGLTVHEGGAPRPGGRASMEPRATAEPPGGTGGPRPGRASSGGQGGRSPAAGEGPRPATGPRSGPTARPRKPTPEVAGERPATTEPTAKPGEAPAEVKVEPVKSGGGKSSRPPKKPRAGKSGKRSSEEKAQERLSELQQQKANKEAELKALAKQRESLRQEHNKAVQEKQAALDEWNKAGTAAERQAAREKALAAQQRAKSARESMEELPGEEGLSKELKALEKDIGVESIKADPNSRAKLPCFSAETMVLTPAGPRAIASLQPGELVWSFDFSSGTPKARPILQVHHGRTRAFHIVQTPQGSIRATSQHRFWIETDAAWRSAETLSPGMRLRALDGPGLDVVATSKQPEPDAATFNLSVDEFPTYFVGPGVLVHNQAVDIGLGGNYTIYRATNPNYPEKVYIGQTTDLDAQGKPRGVEGRQFEHQGVAREKLRLDAEGIEKLSARDRAYYEFMKDATLEPKVKGIGNQAQADFLEQHNIDLERKVSGENNVINRRNQITSESHMKEVVEKIKSDPAVKAKGYCP